MKRLLAAMAIAFFVSIPSVSARSEPRSSTPGIDGKNSGGRSEITGEASETIELPDSGSGSPASPPRPAVSASDPSMWDEQPHQDCVSNGGQIPDMDCIADKILHPSRPQEDAPAAGGGCIFLGPGGVKDLVGYAVHVRDLATITDAVLVGLLIPHRRIRRRHSRTRW